MTLYVIAHADTGVIRRSTTAPLAEVGVGEDEIAYEIPGDTKLDLSQLLRIDASLKIEAATPEQVRAAGLDEAFERQKEDERRASAMSARDALASIDPASETVDSLADKIRAYFAAL